MFARNVAVGFLLLVAVFLSIAFLTAGSASLHGPVQTLQHLFHGVTVFVFVCLMGGILLLVLNRSIARRDYACRVPATSNPLRYRGWPCTH